MDFASAINEKALNAIAANLQKVNEYKIVVSDKNYWKISVVCELFNVSLNSRIRFIPESMLLYQPYVNKTGSISQDLYINEEGARKLLNDYPHKDRVEFVYYAKYFNFNHETPFYSCINESSDVAAAIRLMWPDAKFNMQSDKIVCDVVIPSLHLAISTLSLSQSDLNTLPSISYGVLKRALKTDIRTIGSIKDFAAFIKLVLA